MEKNLVPFKHSQGLSKERTKIKTRKGSIHPHNPKLKSLLEYKENVEMLKNYTRNSMGSIKSFKANNNITLESSKANSKEKVGKGSGLLGRDKRRLDVMELKSGVYSSNVRSPRNRNSILQTKLSDKETNLKTETTLFDKNKLESYDISVCVDKEKEGEKDKLINKLNSRIFELENKLKDMDKFILPQNQNFDTVERNLTQGDNTSIKMNLLAHLNTDSTIPYILQTQNTSANHTLSNDVNKLTIPISHSIPNNKSKHSKNSLSSKGKIGQGKLFLNKNLLIDMGKIKEKLNNKFIGNNKTILSTTSDHNKFSKGINFDLFKPLVPNANMKFSSISGKSIYELYKNTSKLSKTTIKSSFDKSKDSKTLQPQMHMTSNINQTGQTIHQINQSHAENKSLKNKISMSTKFKCNRKTFFMNEMKINSCEDSFINEEESIKPNTNDMKQKFQQIKDRTQKLLMSLTIIKEEKQINASQEKVLKKHSHSKSDIFS